MSEQNKALAPVQSAIPQPATETSAIVSMIERAARDPSIDMDKMERLMAMHERTLARNAEQDFNGAMALAQSEMRAIAADSNNPQTKSKYASYFALDKALRPIYTGHGFALSFNTEPGAPETVRVVCNVSHVGGHSRKYQVDMPADGKGAKGGDVMTKTHAAGAAMSYGTRYLLKMIFNVAVGEDDDDGNGATQADKIGAEQVAWLQSLIVEVGADIPKFLKYFKVQTIADLPVSNFQRAIDLLNSKRKAP